ncbi:hypothetical protein ANCCAN_09615 [Ancylostoma caninum]|uniref:Uncharacterized protein n=1 Tax=Ancylostoma caninum TaxID=29170 RepID=A0A368GJ36_ANCCA|nr:hypothetical protein ANCCAN_09615 [Ancylostoma caninum]
MAIGNGEIEQDSEGRIHLPSDLMSNGNLIDEVFGDELTNTDNLSDYAILAPRNFDVNRINEEAIDRSAGPLQEYKSIDDVVGENQDESTTYTSEFLNSLSPAGLPPHKLSLRSDCNSFTESGCEKWTLQRHTPNCNALQKICPRLQYCIWRTERTICFDP